MANSKESVIVCRCREVTEQEVLDAIEDGATTITGVKRRTHAGMGLCQGKSCSRLVARLISQKTGKPLKEVLPATVRPPVRPVKLSALAEGDER